MFDDELYVCSKCGATRIPGELCPICAQRERFIEQFNRDREKEMASKKKPVVPAKQEEETDWKSGDVAKLKQEMANAALDVENKIKGLTIPMNIPSPTFGDWEQAKSRVNRMDEEFTDLGRVQGDVDVRVLQVGPDGRLTDVSDRVNPRDLQPEQIEDFQSSDNSVRLPRQPNGKVDKEAALDFMSQLIGVNRKIRTVKPGSPESTEHLREMEAILAESDKILAKLRR